MQSPKFRFYKILIDGKDEYTITYIFFCVNSFAAAATTTTATETTAATAATTESQPRGSGSDAGSGVVTGRSKKKEILYKKTTAWSDFYDAAK